MASDSENTIMSNYKTIEIFKQVFLVFGLPEQIVSDN